MFLAIKANYTHAVGLGTRLTEVKLTRPFVSRGLSAQTHLTSFESLNHPVPQDARGANPDPLQVGSVQGSGTLQRYAGRANTRPCVLQITRPPRTTPRKPLK